MGIVVGFIVVAAIGLTGVGAGVITTGTHALLSNTPSRGCGNGADFLDRSETVRRARLSPPKAAALANVLLLMAGCVPGVHGGSLLLNHFRSKHNDNLLYAVLGLTIVTFASLNLYTMINKSGRISFRDRSRWLPLIALPIGAETGFSSAGAIGSVALLGLTTLSAAQVVGTDVFFGLGLSLVGGGIQLSAGHYVPALHWRLIIGGIPEILAGANLSAILSSRPLRVGLSLWIIALGTQLYWRGLAS